MDASLGFSDSLDDIDYYFEKDGTIVVPNNNVSLSAKILRIVNASGLVKHRMVKLSKKGDAIILGIDELIDVAPVDSYEIGPDKLSIVVKKSPDGKFYLYDNNKRIGSFKSKAAYKRYVGNMHKTLQDQHEIPEENYETE